MENFYNQNLYVNEDDNNNGEAYQDPSLTLFNPFLMDQFPSEVNENPIDFTPEMLFNIGMKGSNMHSALFNQPPKTYINQMPNNNDLFQNPYPQPQPQPQPTDMQLFNNSATFSSTNATPMPLQQPNLNPNNLQLPYQPQPQAPQQTLSQGIPQQTQLSSPNVSVLKAPKLTNSQTTGIYSSTGFDLLNILVYIANRPNPIVNIGPIDLSCAFLLVDARQYDFPIVYASPTFETLTGYTPNECVGRNCRFLQAPDGRVTEGSRRKFSDNNSIFMFKNKIMAVQEHQASLVNYKKNGQAFFNLVTIIPIVEGGSVNFFVGLQVDLVDQPNAIINNLKNSAFSINYGKPTFTKTISSEHKNFNELPNSIPYENLASIFDDNANQDNNNNNHSEANYREWIKYMLDKCDDFIYVLSLKGTFLYASPSSKNLLGYASEDLIGQNLAKICHPGDLVPTLRELKEIGNNENSINLTFRFKVKDGAEYSWLESSGKLHGDLGKGRRCIVLTGRIRQMFQLSSGALIETGGDVGDNDLFFKLSNDGIILHASSNLNVLLGYEQQEIIGTTLYQLLPADRSYTLTNVLEQAASGNSARFNHHLQNKRGNLIVTTSSFFPGNETNPIDPEDKTNFILLRMNLELNIPPNELNVDYKVETLISNPFHNMDDIFRFDENNSKSSWQYELHQLKIKNRKLKEQINALDPISRNKKKKNGNRKVKTCMSCNRTSTTEWRRGPNGPSTLCNPCGLKYAKGSAPFNKMSRGNSDSSQSKSQGDVSELPLLNGENNSSGENFALIF
ncbi:hypothetical protein K502DRAFT_366727 [Neoconidiobolus thromboides FSU 785]|nr:hypothetical protein K502DRAFT_366727 [Neoconidiobolus thromboides FSU 785]